MTMVKHRIREWLMDHPDVLWFMFLIGTYTTEYGSDALTQSGTSAYAGP